MKCTKHNIKHLEKNTMLPKKNKYNKTIKKMKEN